MNKGIIYTFLAYALWGFFPIYFRALHGVPAFQTMTHRVVWSFLFILLIITLRKGWSGLKRALTPRNLFVYLAAGLLLAVNWLVYVWAVGAGFILESSLGYFINPLVSVLLGVIFLKERLRPMQWLPVGLAGLAVIYLTITHGSLPWISLSLAFSFGFYGLVKKVAPLGSLDGLTLETGILFLPALVFLLAQESLGVGTFGHNTPMVNVLLALTGVVTAVPLLLFATGARLIPLTTVGILQYIAPTLQFLIGAFLFGEPFTHQLIIGFCVIWVALIIFTAEGIWSRRRLITTGAA
jgi:chloramphenicol-sensitive protein RarD